MFDQGLIRGTHHLTFCVGGAQEDYDFHVRLLGLRSIKKTVLFDGEIPIYHLYYANRIGTLSTILTSFPYRQAGWMGRRGTNQLRTINVAVPADSLGYWADRLRNAGLEVAEAERLGTQRLDFAHPCGIPYSLVGETGTDDREPWNGGDVPLEHAIRGAYGTTTSVREPEPMDEFLRRAFGAEHVASEGPHHQYRIGIDGGGGRQIELVEEPDLPQGSWSFGEGTIHHHAFDVDTPGGALFELASNTEQGFLIDEAEDELGTHMCIPPHWEDRRGEISQLEPIDTEETVVG
jgi:glyoxalase family protein